MERFRRTVELRECRLAVTKSAVRLSVLVVGRVQDSPRPPFCSSPLILSNKLGDRGEGILKVASTWRSIRNLHTYLPYRANGNVQNDPSRIYLSLSNRGNQFISYHLNANIVYLWSTLHLLTVFFCLNSTIYNNYTQCFFNIPNNIFR